MRAVKAHLGTSPFDPHRHASAPQPRSRGRTTQRHADAATLPALKLTVPRAVTCYWHGCSQTATTRIAFQTPSLLAGETRDYCPRHTKQVALQPGTATLASLHVHPENPA